VIVHVGTDLMTLTDPAGNAVDLYLPAMTHVRVSGRGATEGRARTAEMPKRFRARLSEAQATGERLELGTAGERVVGTVMAVADDHVDVEGQDGGEWIVPLRSVVYLVRRPADGPGRSRPY
jgi:hypothetical protein